MIYYGCDEVTKGWERYFQMCTALEVVPADPIETIATLNKWRVQSPKGFAFVSHVTPEFVTGLTALYDQDHLSLDPIEDRWTASVDRAKALGAKAMMVSTSDTFRPSDTTRALIAELGKKAKTIKQCVIWEASGLWDPEEVRSLCKESGIVPTFDPFVAKEDGYVFGSGDVCFRITERAGARRHFDEWDFHDLKSWAEGYDRAFLLFAGRYKALHAKTMSLVERDD